MKTENTTNPQHSTVETVILPVESLDSRQKAVANLLMNDPDPEEGLERILANQIKDRTEFSKDFI